MSSFDRDPNGGNDDVLSLETSIDAEVAEATLRLVAHDINNPLTAIRILAEMLGDDVAEPYRQDMADILEAADLASAIVARVGGAASAGRPRSWLPFDVADMLRQLVRRPALERHVRLDLPEELAVRGDVVALGSALTDILINARGLVADEVRIVVRGQQRGDYVRIVVTHPGATPLPSQMRNHLFHRRGVVALRECRIPVSAIGLVDAYASVTGHGGTLSVEDADDGGILVVMTLPA